MRIAVHQPNYIPWCGFFAKMLRADVFVFLDDVQISKGSYVARCRIRDAQKENWLSIPISTSSGMLIRDVAFANAVWPRKHLQTLRTCYGRAARFDEIFPMLEPLYERPGTSLAEFNIRLILAVAGYLEIVCRFERSSELKPAGKGDERLISLAASLGATTYVSGKGGQNYQDPAKFHNAGISLEFCSYDPVPYPQIHDGFIPGLSILDALFNIGKLTRGLLVAGNA